MADNQTSETATRSFDQDAIKALWAFDSFVAPALKILGAKRIFSTELHNNGLEKFLDQETGIDAVIVTDDGTAYPIACRVQFDKYYASFSIRRSRPSGKITEYAKLKAAFQANGLMPTYHIQGFVTDGIATIAIAETVDLLKYVERHSDQWRTSPEGETFYYIPWRKLDKVKVYIADKKGHIQRRQPYEIFKSKSA